MPKQALLTTPGWTDQNRSRLEQLIHTGAGKHLPVIFDFDNTIVAGDIGEATFAWLVRSGALAANRLPESLCPPLSLADGQRVTLASVVDLTEYYEAFLMPTMHGPKDPAPMANSYLWAVEVMEGLNLNEVVQATRQVMELAQRTPGSVLAVTPGKTGYPLPHFYPEIVELIAVLIRHRFDVWIVSASNVWSVRWMVRHGLNPRLRQLGIRSGLPPKRVRGVSTLLADRRGGLHKDAVLVRSHPDYARLEDPALKPFRLTRLLQYPPPVYSGKVATIWDEIGQRPYLCAGDSPGDHAMLSFSEHRLWIARLEKPAYQQATRKLIRQTGESGWMIQPTRSREAPGFLPDA